jgi:hypothetical protein
MNYENISAEEFTNSIPLNWWERQQLLREQQVAAKHAIFSHDWTRKWKVLFFIPTEYQSPLLVCDWCKCEATRFQTIPVKALFCSTCTRELERERRNLYRRNKRWKDGAESRRIAEISKRA